jgi:phosphate transport system substrate-binding protein
VGGKGNEGVASYVQKINGAIGYVEYAYAKQNRLPHGQVQNRDGKFVEPDDVTFKAAAAGADWKSVPGMGVVLTDQAGAASWPITGASFILMHANQEKPEAGREVIRFFEWAFRNGQKMAEELDYVPMPEAVIKEIQASWKGVKDAGGKTLY